MDIKDLMPSAEPEWFVLTDVRGNDMKSGGKPVRLRLHGPDSPTMLEFDRKRSNRQLKALARSRNQQLNLDAEAIDDDATEHAITALADWEWADLTFDGKPGTFSLDNARTLVSSVRWIRDWIEEKVRDRGNF